MFSDPNSFMVEATTIGRDWTIQEHLWAHDSIIRTGVWACLPNQPERIITGSFDETVKIWRANRNHWQLQRQLIGHSRGVCSIAVSPDHVTFATCSRDSIVRIWRTEDGQLLRIISNDYHFTNLEAWCLDYSHDGRNIICGNLDSRVKIYSTLSGEPIQTIYLKGSSVNSVKCSPDGKYIACAGANGILSLYDVQGEKVAHVFQDLTNPVTDIAFSPDSKVLLAGSDVGELMLYDVVNRAVIAGCLPRYRSSVTSVDYSSNGRWFCTTYENDYVMLWDATTRQLVNIMQYRGCCLYDTRFSPDSTRCLTVASDQSFKIFGSSVLR